MAKLRMNSMSALAAMLVVIGVLGPLWLYHTVEEHDHFHHRRIGENNPISFPGHERIQQAPIIKGGLHHNQQRLRPQAQKQPKGPHQEVELQQKQLMDGVKVGQPFPPLRQQQQQQVDKQTFPDNDELHHYEQFATKSSYDPALHPVFSQVRKIKTRFVSQKITSGKVKHIFLEGMEKSDYIDLVHVSNINIAAPRTPAPKKNSTAISTTPPPYSNTNETYQDYGEELWIDDSPFAPSCKNTEAYAKKNREGKGPVMVLQLDYKDFEKMGYCDHLHEYVGGRQYIRYAKRSIIQARKYNYSESGWIDHGHFRVNDGANFTGGPTIHAPYTVRTDQVELIFSKFWNQSWPGAYPDKKWDVSHFWSVGNDPVSHLRNQVTTIIKSMKGMRLPNGHSMRCYANLAGQRGTKGRKGIQEQYVELMLKSKIIVVTQRDPWEGHYRLMEGLASGAMIVADFMLSLPKGLKDRESVVLFRSEAELREVLPYYVQHDEDRLRIARKGWEVVMSRHRAWHRLEELLFGRPLTDVDNPYGPYNTKPSITTS